jgi:hypothetical protein
MTTNTKIKIELEVSDVQEMLSTIETTMGKIQWVIENNPPRKPNQLQLLQLRLLQLTRTSVILKRDLNARALENSNVILMGEKK